MMQAERSDILGGRYDAIVVGTGAGGSSLAHRLGQQGLRVLVLERGTVLPTQAPTGSQMGRYITDVLGDRSVPLSFTGGQTKFYGAALYRLRQSDFLETRHEAGTSPAWPIDYAALEPYYTQAEQLYRVHGAPDGDPSEPPRSAPYPFPPLPHGPIVRTMVERLQKSGTPVAAQPRGIDYRPGGRCTLCAGCDAFQCQVDAKMDAEVAALRPAIAMGNVRLATGVECLRVLTDSDGTTAIGILVRHEGGEQTLHAPVIAVCAGQPGSAALLRRSRTTRHTEGLGNNTGALGRYLAGHSTGMIFPFVSLAKLPPIHTKTFAINSFYEGAPDWPYPCGVIQIAGQMPFWDEARRPLRPIARLIGEHSFMCFYMTEAPPSRDAGLIFDGDRVVGQTEPPHNLETFNHMRKLTLDVFRRAGYRALARRRAPYLWHDVGTARFGADPATSVTDPNCEVHGIRNLFVVDASTLPSAGAVNTGLTIIALALRVGDHIAAQARG